MWNENNHSHIRGYYAQRHSTAQPILICREHERLNTHCIERTHFWFRSYHIGSIFVRSLSFPLPPPSLSPFIFRVRQIYETKNGEAEWNELGRNFSTVPFLYAMLYCFFVESVFSFTCFYFQLNLPASNVPTERGAGKKPKLNSI